MDNFPGLRVHVIAVKFVGQRVVCSTTKHVEMPVKCHHGVAVPSLWRRRGAPQQVLSRNSCPAETPNIKQSASFTFILKVSFSFSLRLYKLTREAH